MKILITGTAGFIGYHLAKRMLEDNHEVIGIDNINDYYDVNLKYARLEDTGIKREDVKETTAAKSVKYNGYTFYKADLTNSDFLNELCAAEGFDCICNLAAQAGVRYSIENPKAYIDSNIVGFTNILEACRHYKVKHLVYASSSSVYGSNEIYPFKTTHNVDHPVSLYAASKKSNELMAHTYSHLYDLPTTGLRFFTVYGPWGRPDMAAYLFTKAIFEGNEIKVYNNGKMSRDFTYIDDIVEGVIRAIQRVPKKNENWSGKTPDPSSSKAPYKVYNIGNNQPVELMDFIAAIEKYTGMEAKKNYMPLQAGDVLSTWADVTDLIKDVGYEPNTPIENGVENFVKWYKWFYKI